MSHQHIGTTTILAGAEVEEQILSSSLLSMLSLIIPACQSRRENNGHMEILPLHALSALLSSGAAKKSRLAGYCVNDTVKRPKWSATAQPSLLLSALLSHSPLGNQGNRLENMPVVWERRSQHLAFADKNLERLRTRFCQTLMATQSTPTQLFCNYQIHLQQNQFGGRDFRIFFHVVAVSRLKSW